MFYRSWDQYYKRDLKGDGNDDDDDNEGAGGEKRTANDNELIDPWELDTWFSDVGAPQKMCDFLTSSNFPLSPECISESGQPLPSVLDLGTGNGSLLFCLQQDDGYEGRMVGVDYSARSIELAGSTRDRLASQQPHISAITKTEFYVLDIMNDFSSEQEWWPNDDGGFDLVLDKGTFDAISLSSATTADSAGRERRLHEVYPSKVLPLVKMDGFFLITSCNWTEAEIISWFTAIEENYDVAGRRFEVFDTIKYRQFKFGGQAGQGVASVCFKKV
jgi:EEF1A lysine methyltransferase 2